MEEVKPDVTELEGNVSRTPTSRAEFPPGMAPKMLKIVKVLNDLESKMKPLISKPHHEVLNKLSPLDRAKVGLMEVYTINSLFWVLMRTSGEDVDSTLRDSYKIEMGRLKETQSRLAEIEARSHRQHVDTDAANRFIRHGLGLPRRGGQSEDDDESPLPDSYDLSEKLKKLRQKRAAQQRNDFEDTVDDNSGYQEYESAHPGPHPDSYNFAAKIKEIRQSKGPQHSSDNCEDTGDGSSGNQEEDMPQATPEKKKKKKKKKKEALNDSIPQSSDVEFVETSNDNSGYQGSGEDSFLPSPPKKVKKEKKVKKVANCQPSDDENVVPPNKKLKMKASHKSDNGAPSTCKTTFGVPPSKKINKKKDKPNGNSYEGIMADNTRYCSTGADCEALVPHKEKKKRKVREEENTVCHSCEDDVREEVQHPEPVPSKKTKKKVKGGPTISQADIASFLDTTRSSIDYKIEDDRDLSNKGRQWYEQGWT